MSGPAPITFETRRLERFSEIEIQLRFITPIFGGGTKLNPQGKGSQLKHYDEITPVRGASIRGQLRFWWRATTGATLNSLEDVKQREGTLFGTAAKESNDSSGQGLIGVRIDSSTLDNAEEIEVFRRKAKGRFDALEKREGIAYGAFPLTPSSEDECNGFKAPGTVYKLPGNFKLTVTYPQDENLEKELRLALSAWVAFGGLGGRTRRGFGRLAEVKGNTPILKTAREVLDTLANQDVNSQRDFEKSIAFPYIDGSTSQWKHKKNCDHNRALNQLRRFRQGAKVARKAKDEEAFGARSHWPDADSVRRITKSTHQKLRPRPPEITKFPRAAFGLPIIFHFRKEDVQAGDPDDWSLQPVAYGPKTPDGCLKERMPSPLCIAPQDDDSTYFLVLKIPDNHKVALSEVGKHASTQPEAPHEWLLTDHDRKELERRSKSLFTHTNAVYAFLKFA